MMLEFAGLFINPYEIAYCQIYEQAHQLPVLAVTLTCGESFAESFETMEELREVLDEIAEFINPMVDYEDDH
jgi:hypothetical protein